MVPVLRHGTRVCEVWALVLLCYLIRGCNSFANGTVSFSTTTLQKPTAITINFTTTHTLMANEVIHIYLPRFTRRLKEDMKFSTYMPSRSPTAVPTKPPAYSFAPTANPTPSPTAVPSVSTPPSPLPTSPTPTARPTPKPTPAASPSGQPTGQPTRQPTRQPTGQPTGQPSRRPTAQPSRQPTRQPSAQPSGRPTVYYYPYHRSSAPIQPTTPSPTQYYSQKSFVYDVVIGSLILSPSSIFVGAWTEGNWKNYNTSHKETNYPGGMITLSRAAAFNNSGMWIPNNQSISLVIYADNGIGAYCGFAGSDAPESTTRFTGTANNGNQNVNFDQRFLMLTNYSKFPWEYPMSVHMWPVNLYNGLKNRLLPNVSYVVPEWEGMGPGCTAVVGSKGCSGHGICDYCSGRCSCFEGYGGEKDVLMPALQAAPDCSLRTCPAGPAIADVALTATKAHRIAECSNAGNCNRQTGECECFPPWTGAACQRMRCPNDCSGHGECLSIRQIARLASMEGSFKGGVYHAHNIYYGKGLFSEDAMHSTERPNATVDFNENVLGEFSGPGGSQRTNYTAYYTRAETTQWDHDTFYACVCESSWSVGLDPGQTQMGEWFGPDCSQRHCPSGDDPFTSKNELHCNGINQLSDEYPEKGKVGNLCQVDCANRGVCDYSTGLCNCFKGSYGPACTATSRTGVYKDAATAPAEDYLPPFKSDNTSAYQQIELGVDDFGAAGADRRRALDGEEEEAAPVADNDQPAASNPFY